MGDSEMRPSMSVFYILVWVFISCSAKSDEASNDAIDLTIEPEPLTSNANPRISALRRQFGAIDSIFGETDQRRRFAIDFQRFIARNDKPLIFEARLSNIAITPNKSST
jgi:hypothetical protein